jgi:hypothetical protein
MLHFIGHCHKLDLEKWRENSKLVDVLYLHKSFFLSHPSLAKRWGQTLPSWQEGQEMECDFMIDKI